MMAQPQLLEVADGIFAWIGVAGDSNAGAIETPDGLVFIDSQQHERLGRQLRDAVRDRTGLPARALVNTHCHLDHTGGNVLFADVPIIAHQRTAELLREILGPSSVDGWTLTDFEPTARLLWGGNLLQLVPNGDPQLDWFKTRIYGPDYRSMTIIPPTQSFDDGLDLTLPDDTISMRYWGPAHCDGDVVVHLPKRKVIFMGDLLFHGRFPWLGDCDLNGWIDRLAKVLELDVDVVIPGHGPPTDLSKVARFRQLLVDLRNAVEAAIARGASEDAAMREVRLPEYSALPRYPEWISINAKAAYRYLVGNTR